MYTFAIESLDGDERFDLHFDERACRLYDAERRLIRPGADENDTFVVRICLGTECQNACIYCQQGGLTKTAMVDRFDDADADRLVEAIRAEVAARVGAARTTVISFWGGEPLLYLDRIRRLVPRLRAAFDGAVYVALITNGLRLDDDAADFLLAQDIEVTVSHDGPGQKPCRGVEILDDPAIMRSVLRLADAGRLSFSPVLTRCNPTIRGWVAYMRGRLGQRAARIVVPELAYVRPVSEAQRDLVCSPVQMAQNTEDLLACIRGEDDTARPFLAAVRNKTFRLIRMLAGQENVRPYCLASDSRNLVVDVAGRIWTCHNFIDVVGMTHCLGSVFEPTRRRVLSGLRSHKTAVCDGCVCTALCHGGCALEETEGYSCWKKYHQLIPVFYDLVACMTDGRYRLCRILQEDA